MADSDFNKATKHLILAKKYMNKMIGSCPDWTSRLILLEEMDNLVESWFDFCYCHYQEATPEYHDKRKRRGC